MSIRQAILQNKYAEWVFHCLNCGLNFFFKRATASTL